MLIREEAPPQSKTELALELGISRSSLYYQKKLPTKDLALKTQIEKVQCDHKAYGHRRIAWHLGINHKRVRRVMKLFGLQPKRVPKILKKPKDSGQAPMAIPNLLLETTIDAPNTAWQSDFTYLWYQGKFLYLATVIDSFTREILSWHLGSRHTTELISQALLLALGKHGKPKIFHSDQGSEYRSFDFITLLQRNDIQPSMSRKASPWQNGKQESFYGKFKLELGDPESYATVGELMEAIAKQIHYYNHHRIHTALKCPPVIFKKRFEINQLTLSPAEGMSV